MTRAKRLMTHEAQPTAPCLPPAFAGEPRGRPVNKRRTANDILDFSKIEAGHFDLEQQPFALRDGVEDVLDVLAPKAAQKGLELVYCIETNVPQAIVGDLARLRQILVNLVSNAIKFTHEGEVVLTLEAEPVQHDRSRLHFAVRDTGIGIAQDRLVQIFESFTQADASTTRQYGGLTISKRLAELMGGTLWAESQTGEGSTFHFTMEAPTAPSQGQVWLCDKKRLTGKRVLIVDDNASNRRILTRQTERWAMEVQAVSSGGEALALFADGQRFDVGLLDMHMPAMDGLTLARRLREAGQEMPLVLLSSRGDRIVVEMPLFSASLTKPIKSSKLCDVLIEVFGGQVVEPVPSLPPVARQDARASLRILLAEDDQVNQKVALRLLGRLGYRADVVANGREVLEALERVRYDVILMDVQMPEMDGLETTRQIVARYEASERPWIIAMTAYAMAGDRQHCLDAGMDDYLSQPARLAKLDTVLRRCLPSKTDATNVVPERLPIVDEAVLQALRNGLGEDDPVSFNDLFATFLENATKLLNVASWAAKEGDRAALQRAARTLRSMGSAFGAERLSQLCQELEQMGKQGNLGEAAAKAAQAKTAFSDVRREIQTHWLR